MQADASKAHSLEPDRNLQTPVKEEVLHKWTAEEKARQEKRLVRKLDAVIMPLTMLLYLFSYLDRSNLGNARVIGAEEDVFWDHRDGYDLASSMALFHPPYWIGAMTIGWGLASTLQAVMFNTAGACAARFWIGFFEAGFGPSTLLYFSFWYTREEYGLRACLFVGTAAGAGVFGGILGYGVSLIHSHLENWNILFLVEGLPTICLGILIIFALPGRPEGSRYLTEEERVLAVERMNRGVTPEKPNSVDLKTALKCFADPYVYVYAVIYFGLNVSLASIAAFLPTIIKTLGYSASRAQLMQVPPYSLAFVVIVVCGYLSDRWRVRSVPMILLGLVGGAGYLILATVHDNQAVRYFAIFLSVPAIYLGIPIVVSWISNNSATESKRAVGVGLVVSIGHCGSVTGSHIYPKQEGPLYIKGVSICAAFAFLAAVLAALLAIALRRENAKKDRLFGPARTENTVAQDEGESSAAFRYVI